MKPGKAVVLARGLGTRMRREADAIALSPEQAAAADAGAKAMMTIEGRPFLDYTLSALADAGWTEVCLVVAPEHALLRDYYTRVAPPRRVSVAFAVQPEPRGTADALLAAEAWVGMERCLVVNADNYYPLAVLRALRGLPGAGTALFTRDGLVAHGNIPADRVRAFALCRVSDAGLLVAIVEKPDRADDPHDFVSMNCWLMPPDVFEACRRIRPSVRGELEIADAVTWLLEERGVPFTAVISPDGVLDLSRRSDVASVSRALATVVASP